MTYAPVDIIFLLIVLLFAISAFARGLVKEFFGKAALVCGIIFALLFSSHLFPYVQSGIKNELLSKLIAFLLIFVIVFLLVKIIQEIVAKFFSGDILKSLDRSLGLVFGIIEGLALVALILVILTTQPWFSTEGILGESAFYRFLLPIVDSSAKKIQTMAG